MSFITRFGGGYRIGELEASMDHAFLISAENKSDLFSKTFEEAEKLPTPKGFFEKLGYHLAHLFNDIPSEFY